MHEQGSTTSPIVPIPPSRGSPYSPVQPPPKLHYPMWVTPSWFSASRVQMAILSPLVRMLMTAPHTSSLYSSNISPMRHSSCWEEEGEAGTVPPGAQPWGRGSSPGRSLRRGSTHCVQPEAIQLRVPLLLGQRDEPAPTALVLAVLPHGLNAILGAGKGTVRGTKYCPELAWGAASSQASPPTLWPGHADSLSSSQCTPMVLGGF